MGSKLRKIKKQAIFKLQNINYQVSEWTKKVKFLKSFDPHFFNF